MRVAIIDSSCFSLPYDHCLCEALSRQNCEVNFISSHFLYTTWNHEVSYQRYNHYYNWTRRLYKDKVSGLGRPFIKGIEHFWDQFRLIRYLQKWKPDIVHFQWLPVPIIDYWFLLNLKRQANLILTIHDSRPFLGSPTSGIQQVGFSLCLRLFNHLIVHTYFTKNELIEKFRFPEEKISVIPHGVLDYYPALVPHKNDESKTTQEKIILFFGVIKPYKGVDILIRAFAQLPNNLQKKTRLLIAGYPKMPIGPLRSIAQQLGVFNRISWDLEFLPDQKIASLFQKASVVVLPYRHIDQSGVLMIALAFGKPIVATKVGGFAEILKNGVHGYLVKSEDPSELALALERILNEPEEAKKMQVAIQHLTKSKLSWENIALSTIEVYKTLQSYE